MKRKELLERLGDETGSATLAYYAYMHSDREYMMGQKLYLREMHFLQIVGSNEDITMSRIAEKLEVTQGAATQIAARLLKKQLVEKIKDNGDKRYTAIRLTPQGEEVYQAYQKYNRARRDEINALLDDFNDVELAAVLRYQQRVRQICKA